eukprot:707868-Pelagomonas_calceolata.AAC.4
MSVPVGKVVCMQNVMGIGCTGKGVESTGSLNSPSRACASLARDAIAPEFMKLALNHQWRVTSAGQEDLTEHPRAALRPAQT